MVRLLCFGFLLVPFLGMGQVVDTAGVRREVDSLVQVCKDFAVKGQFEEALVEIGGAEMKAEAGFGNESLLYAKSILGRGFVLELQKKYGDSEFFYTKAIQIIEKKVGKKHPAYAKGLTNLAFLFQKMSRYDESESVFIEIKNITEETLGNLNADYAATLYNLANLYKITGKLEDAEKLYIESKNVREKTVGKTHPTYTDCLNNLGTLYTKMGRFKDAELLHLEALEIREKTLGKDNPEYARSLRNLAQVYEFTTRYDEAEKLYILSMNIRQKVYGKMNQDYAKSVEGLANLYLTIGRFSDSEKLFSETSMIYAKIFGKDSREFAINLRNFSSLYQAMGQYAKSETILIESKSILEKKFGKQNIEYTLSIGTLAVLYLHLGRYAESEKYCLEVRDILGKPNAYPAFYINNLITLGALYTDYMPNFQLAEKIYLEAIDDLKDNDDASIHYLSLINLSVLYKKMGRYNDAQPVCLEVKKFTEKTFGKEHRFYAQSLINLAEFYEFVGKIDSAELLCIEASKVISQSLGEENPDFAQIVYDMSNLYEAKKRDFVLADSLRNLSNSIRCSFIVKSARYFSEKELFNYIKTFENDIFTNLSFAYNHKISPILLNSICYDNAIFYNGFLFKAASQIRHLALQDTLSLKVFNLLSSKQFLLSHEYAKPIAERSQYVSQWEEEANTLEKELVRTVPGYEEAIKPVTWKNVQSNLHSNEAAIEFVHFQKNFPNPTDSTLYAALLLLPSDTTPHFIPLCEERQLDALLYKPKGNPANYLQNLYASTQPDGLPSLYQLLWNPIEQVLKDKGVKTVYYAPSGLLHRINLVALASDKSGQTLADRYHLVSLGSTRELVSTHPESHTPTSAVIYGGVRYDMDSTAITRANVALNATAQDTTGGWFRYVERNGTERGDSTQYLQGTEKEALYLNQLLQKQGINATMCLGYSASEESFKQIGRDGPSPNLLHIGTHGFFFPDPKDTTHRRASFGEDAPAFKISEHPLIRSGLKLAGSDYAWNTKHPMHGMEDGILTAYEVSQMNLSNTELVVLSACETGLGDIKGNEGVYGLQRAFRIAGAKNVLMSLWKVPDEATEKLMTRFYKNWLEKKMPVREAFEQAQGWLRGQEQYRNPYFWAGFVLVE